MFYLKQRDIQVNLLVMTYMWGTVSFTYYLISFQLKYLPGDVYNNSMASSGSELLAYILGGILYNKIGIRLAFCFSYLISVVGGVMILFWGTNNPQLMPIFVTLAKFGISSGFVIVYVSTVDVFPTLFCATALGFCNFFARVATILAPLIAEKQPPLPMLIFTSMTAVGSVLALFIRPAKKEAHWITNYYPQNLTALF